MTERLGNWGMQRPGLVWAFHVLSVPLGPRLVTEPCKCENLSYCRVFILLSSHDSILGHCTLCYVSWTLLPTPTHLTVPPHTQQAVWVIHTCIGQHIHTCIRQHIHTCIRQYIHTSGNAYMHRAINTFIYK